MSGVEIRAWKSPNLEIDTRRLGCALILGTTAVEMENRRSSGNLVEQRRLRFSRLDFVEQLLESKAFGLNFWETPFSDCPECVPGGGFVAGRRRDDTDSTAI